MGRKTINGIIVLIAVIILAGITGCAGFHGVVSSGDNNRW